MKQGLQELVERLWADMKGLMNVRDQGVGQVLQQGNFVLDVNPSLVCIFPLGPGGFAPPFQSKKASGGC